MKREKKEKHFIHKPEYPGGPRAMHKHIYSHLKYPKEAIEHGVTGYVRVKITIDYQGKVVNTKVINHLGYGCDEEAERVLRTLTFHVPKNRGVKVQFFKTLRIRFKPTKQATTPTRVGANAVQLTYKYKSSTETAAPSETKGYTYTINL